ncbi:energy transducer TonB [Variovorax sp. AFSI2.2]|uniref:energy transducer TonB n=1 Tax=Variovorax sp. AFSI2.2 TaxID=3384160 RepID=UPI003EB77F0B
MSTLSRKDYRGSDPSRRVIGWAVVAGVHVVVGYALLSGTTRGTPESTRKPMEAVVIQDVFLPPPPPPPPPSPKEVKRVVSKAAPAPPMSRAPTPPAPTPLAAPAIEPASAPSVAPALEPAAVAPPAPTAPIAPPAAPGRVEIGVACPTQVRPEMPAAALRDGVDGVVKAQLLVREGIVREVTIVSGPKVFHAAVKKAAAQYKCANQPTDVVAVQEFVFKNSD